MLRPSHDHFPLASATDTMSSETISKGNPWDFSISTRNIWSCAWKLECFFQIPQSQHPTVRYFLIFTVNGNPVCQNLVSHHIVLKKKILSRSYDHLHNTVTCTWKCLVLVQKCCFRGSVKFLRCYISIIHLIFNIRASTDIFTLGFRCQPLPVILAAWISKLIFVFLFLICYSNCKLVCHTNSLTATALCYSSCYLPIAASELEVSDIHRKFASKNKVYKGIQPCLAFIWKVTVFVDLWLEELKSTRGEILFMFTLPMSVDYYNLWHYGMDTRRRLGNKVRSDSLTTARTSSCTHLNLSVEEAIFVCLVRHFQDIHLGPIIANTSLSPQWPWSALSFYVFLHSLVNA